MAHLTRTARAARGFALVAALLLALAACGGSGTSSGGGSGGGSKTIRVELFCSGLAPVAAELTQNSGIATKMGLTIKPMCVTSGSTATQALIGGSADVFMGDIGHVILAQEKGIKLRSYAVANDKFSYQMVARKDAKLTSVKDLKGKKVAVTAPGTLSDTELQKAALDAGLNPKTDLTVVSGGAGATMQGELKGGQVVAGMTSQPDTLLLLKTGDFKVLWKEPDYNYVDIVVMANEKWVSKNRATMKTFLASMNEASTKAKADPALATTWMKKQGYKISDADLSTIVKEALASIPDGLRTSKAVASSSADLLVRTGLLQKPLPPYEGLYDYSLLPSR